MSELPPVDLPDSLIPILQELARQAVKNRMTKSVLLAIESARSGSGESLLTGLDAHFAGILKRANRSELERALNRREVALYLAGLVQEEERLMLRSDPREVVRLKKALKRGEK